MMHQLINWPEKKKIPCVAETSIYDDNGNNTLEELTKYLAGIEQI